MLFYPEEAALDAALQAARSLQRRGRWAAELAYYETWKRFLDRMARTTNSQGEELKGRYMTLFAGSTVSPPVGLHETSYLNRSAAFSGEVIADLENHYAQSGLSVSPSNGESADHAAVQMDFVSFLCGQEHQALMGGNHYLALEAVTRQRHFLWQHPCQWFPYMALKVSKRDRDGIYTLATQAAWSIVAHDVDFLRIVSEWLRAVAGGSQDG